MDYSKLTLGELLSHEDKAIRRNAVGILKRCQKLYGAEIIDSAREREEVRALAIRLYREGLADTAIVLCQEGLEMPYDMAGKFLSANS